jgi:hypothetical protein
MFLQVGELGIKLQNNTVNAAAPFDKYSFNKIPTFTETES